MVLCRGVLVVVVLTVDAGCSGKCGDVPIADTIAALPARTVVVLVTVVWCGVVWCVTFIWCM